jgi:hypothetical protein
MTSKCAPKKRTTVVRHLVTKDNHNFINDNWDKLKCSPIGPFLQMTGIAPGNANETSKSCKSAEFSAQFNAGMTEHVETTNKLSSGMDTMNDTMQNIRGVLYNIKKEALNDLNGIFQQIFNIYMKIGNIFHVLIKHIVSIMEIFKGTVHVGTAITGLLVDFINLVREPINGIDDFVQFFERGQV